ncbi:MAG TPA: T9SS type A sorting domain-containing protein [Bacteroidia bacterium]|nr:T9SS type A sorting domain-containing protein [Bacteroidia bacterium]
MKTKFFFLACLFVCARMVFAQQSIYSNWAIGNGGGLKFQNNLVTQFQSQMSCQDIGSTISDVAGNLLFYCNGTTVYNKNHNVMANGTGLLGDITGGHAALILEQPESHFYYIFTMDKYADNDGLRYHIVDMSANGGLGQVITKNMVLLNPASEKIAAVWNSAQNCYKIITHKFGNDEFHVFELNGLGLNTTPVISAIGPHHQQGVYGQSHDALGQIAISPNGQKVALALCYSQIFQVYNFDINTGVLSNPITIGNYPFAWGIEFSPNSQYIYFTQWTMHEVFQADISSGDSATIDNSITSIGNISGGGQYSVGYLSRTPDNRIFIAKYGYYSLATISHPDLPGAACNFDEEGLTLQYGSSTAGLSSSAVFPSNSNSVFEHDNHLVKLYPNPTNGILTIAKTNTYTAQEMNIFDKEGSIVFSTKLNMLAPNETFHLELNPGMYHVKFTHPKNEVYHQKLIVIK